jgi:polyhydroxyalkanoate synthase
MTVPTTTVSFDPIRFSKSMERIAESSQKLVIEFLTQTPDLSLPGMADANAIGAAFLDLTSKMIADPTARRMFFSLPPSASDASAGAGDSASWNRPAG